jgi:hypothetical protein
LPTPAPTTFFSTVFKQQLTEARNNGTRNGSAAAAVPAEGSPAFAAALAAATSAAAAKATATARRARRAQHTLPWPAAKARAAYLALAQQRAVALGLPLPADAEARAADAAAATGPSPLPGARGFGGRKNDDPRPDGSTRTAAADGSTNVLLPNGKLLWNKIKKFPATLPVVQPVRFAHLGKSTFLYEILGGSEQTHVPLSRSFSAYLSFGKVSLTFAPPFNLRLRAPFSRGFDFGRRRRRRRRPSRRPPSRPP